MIWRVLEGEFGSFATIFTEKITDDLSVAEKTAQKDGYRLIGRHAKAPAFLLKGVSDYCILSSRNPEAGPAAAGIVVKDPDAAIDFGWRDDRFEVFSAGAVGPLRLHLPGLRFKPDGQFVYLVAEGGEDHFFAVDFEPTNIMQG